MVYTFHILDKNTLFIGKFMNLALKRIISFGWFLFEKQ